MNLDSHFVLIRHLCWLLSMKKIQPQSRHPLSQQFLFDKRLRLLIRNPDSDLHHDQPPRAPPTTVTRTQVSPSAPITSSFSLIFEPTTPIGNGLTTTAQTNPIRNEPTAQTENQLQPTIEQLSQLNRPNPN